MGCNHCPPQPDATLAAFTIILTTLQRIEATMAVTKEELEASLATLLATSAENTKDLQRVLADLATAIANQDLTGAAALVAQAQAAADAQNAALEAASPEPVAEPEPPVSEEPAPEPVPAPEV